MSSNIDTELDKKTIQFVNIAPEDKEWTAHIELLNEWTEPDRYLREIIQYARSGKFYPADMHVNLIKQLINSIALEVIGEDEPISYGHGQIGNTSEEDRNELRSEQRQSLQKKLGGGR